MSTTTELPPDVYVPKIPFEEQRSELRAEIGRRVAGWLDVTPGVQRVATDKAQLYAVENFLRPAECERLITLIDEGCVPSKLFEQERYDGFRTSQSCDLDVTDPFVVAIEKRISELMKIDFRWGEPLQGQRYQSGQYYKPHPDFFYVDQPYWEEVQKHGGQRTWTAMIYLNRPEQGGGTGFPYLGFTAEPWPGRLLIWNNMAADGSPNSWTIHSGEPVEAGTKYIVTKWYRERPNA